MDQQEYQRRLDLLRQEIDSVDSQLLPLFLQRMDCSQRVAALKKEAGAPVLSAAREQAILERVRQQAGEFGNEAAALYSSIMTISRARQHRLLAGGGELRQLERTAARTLPPAPDGILCQGVEGAYSHQAALRFFGEQPIRFAPTWHQVFREVAEGKARYGVLPVENSAAGSVSGVYDLILQYRFFIVGAVVLAVEHCLAAPEGVGPLTAVTSHPQALAQCSELIESRGYRAVEAGNTAQAAQRVAQERPVGMGVLCSREAARRYGLTILEESVQNDRHNRTRFIVIAREPVFPEDANKISLCFGLPHTPGALYGILERFAGAGLNMTKIESRNIPGSDFEYDFYLDFTGNIHQPETLDVICGLHDELPRFSFLGNYVEGGAV